MWFELQEKQLTPIRYVGIPRYLNEFLKLSKFVTRLIHHD